MTFHQRPSSLIHTHFTYMYSFQHARVLKNERMAELQALSVKAVIYIALR